MSFLRIAPRRQFLNTNVPKKWVERELAMSAEDLHGALLVLLLVARSSRGAVDTDLWRRLRGAGEPSGKKNRVEFFFLPCRADFAKRPPSEGATKQHRKAACGECVPFHRGFSPWSHRSSVVSRVWYSTSARFTVSTV